MKQNKLKPRPFVKWAGGKRTIIDQINKRLPNSFNAYFEPFVGGGAVFFSLREKNQKVFLSDNNPDLIAAYKVIKSSPRILIKELKKHAAKHSESYYYYIRRSSPRDIVDIAARFLYLNKTCYNGLYRVNNSGCFNVPIGDYKNPDIVQEENIIACHDLLKRTKISLCDFTKIRPDKGDFVYFDPPYFPEKENSFTKYTKQNFSIEDQVRLAEFIKKLDKKGVYIMLSNSMTKVISDLYTMNRFLKHVIYAPRYVNCKGDGRGKVNELLITNY